MKLEVRSRAGVFWFGIRKVIEIFLFWCFSCDGAAP